MRVLDRYIVLALWRNIALSMAVLLVLLAVFLFVNEQGWVGAGTYGQLAALRYVGMQLPSTALAFVPVAVLLGALLAVGQLARGSEITVMRAAGVSIARIAGSIALAGLLLVPLALAIGEWVAPSLAQAGRINKALQRDGTLSVAQGAAWLQEGALTLRADGQGGLTVFERDAQGRLASITQSARVASSAAGTWQLQDSTRTRFDDSGVSAERTPVAVLQTATDAQFMRIASHDPRQQSLRQLAADIRVLAARGQDTRRQRFAFWAGIARVAAIPLAMLLALPLLLGVLRNSEAGTRATTGLVLGMLYFIAQRMVESGAVVFDVAPLLLAWAPTLLLGAIVVLQLWRTRGISAA